MVVEDLIKELSRYDKSLEIVRTIHDGHTFDILDAEDIYVYEIMSGGILPCESKKRVLVID